MVYLYLCGTKVFTTHHHFDSTLEKYFHVMPYKVAHWIINSYFDALLRIYFYFVRS